MKLNTESEIERTLSLLEEGFTGNLDGFKESTLKSIEYERSEIPARRRRNVALTLMMALLFLVNIYSVQQVFKSDDTTLPNKKSNSSYLSCYEELDVTLSINKNLTGTYNEK